MKNIDEKIEITLVSYWGSYDAIKKFAGEDINAAKLYPDDHKYELEPDDFVTHYEVIKSIVL